MHTVIGSELLFGAQGNVAQNLGKGWSGPESGFAWAVDDKSDLVIEIDDAPHGFFIEIDVDPFLAQQRIMCQGLVLRVNGKEVGRAHIEKRCIHAWYVPPQAQAQTALAFEHPHASRPADFGLSADNRRLALRFHRLRVLRLSRPFPGLSDRTFIDRCAVSDDQLALQFESVGENCELGFVQRQFGEEPLGLLRFSAGPLVQVVRGIDNGFDGLEDSISPVLSKGGEWMIADNRYQLGYHTFVLEHQASREEVRERERKKCGFLRRKLMEDLAEGYKIFVHQRRQPTSLSEVLPLFLAIRRRGPGYLLWVSPGGAGTVTEIYPGFMHGAISQVTATGLHGEPFLDAWLPILRGAAELRRASRARLQPFMATTIEA